MIFAECVENNPGNNNLRSYLVEKCNLNHEKSKCYIKKYVFLQIFFPVTEDILLIEGKTFQGIKIAQKIETMKKTFFSASLGLVKNIQIRRA